MVPYLMAERLEQLDSEIEKLRDERAVMIDKIIAICPHENVVESQWRNPWDEIQAPWRTCLGCGLSEEGWGCGYDKLAAKSPVASISKDQWLSLSMRRVFQDGHIVDC